MTDESTLRPLGQPGHAVRVLNFASGGFDTVMQLGTAHALLVIQGRAPDAIVGISAGAIQAVAVTEILQAGEEINIDPDDETNKVEETLRDRYRRRQEERVKKLRKFINAAQRAPEELFDASLPDAYQIESLDPLQPLRTSSFTKSERDELERLLRVRSGLVRLYNHMLGIHLPIGAITRIVRRWLGFKAAAEIPGKLSQVGVRLLELFRIWLIIGAQLHRLITIIPMLVRPLFVSKAGARVATAGSLIFRFRALRLLRTLLISVITLFVLSTTWVTLSALPAVLIFFVRDKTPAPWYLQAVIGLSYLFPLLMAFLQAVNRHDAVTYRGALRDGLKGFFQFVVLLFVWGGIAYLFWTGIIYRNDETISEPLKLLSSKIMTNRIQDNPIAQIFLGGTTISLFIVFWAWLRYRWDRARETLVAQPLMTFMSWYGRRFLRSYNLARSLLHHHGLEKFLAELFDPDYFGQINTEKSLEEALRKPILRPAEERDPAICFKTSTKKVRDFHAKERRVPIAVGIGVANVGSGEVEVMDGDAPLVCGLRAATALVPLLPAVNYGGKLYVDSTNISSVPMPALLRLLHGHRVHDQASMIHVYRVAPVPFSQPRLEKQNTTTPFLNLVDIAFRAVSLRQFRDADLERRLTHHYTQVIPVLKSGKKITSEDAKIANKDEAGSERSFFRIWVAPVELELPLGLNSRICFANRTERRAEILRTIAQGCRAALQVMIPDAIEDCCKTRPENIAPCGHVVRYHLKKCKEKEDQQQEDNKHKDKRTAINTVAFQPLPGSVLADHDAVTTRDHKSPPGLAEICKHCQYNADATSIMNNKNSQVLVWRKWKHTAPSWPHEFEQPDGKETDKHFETLEERGEPSGETLGALGRYWPHERLNMKPSQIAPVDRPTISLLFSGGVFRGVFQIGVVNALNELGIKPDIVAGASVGSITAGIAAQILGDLHDANTRRMQLARLAAVYLAVDRIILTDRFADFVREFTIRAAATRFSLRQADWLFRKYDKPLTENFERGARQVIAGIERLFYLNFYQLNKLVKALRCRQNNKSKKLAKDLAQQWLDRMNVGEEVLGAEPIKMLIEHFITIDGSSDFLKVDRDDPKLLRSTFQRFIAKHIVFLATSTDLSDGRLVTLGDPFCPYEESRSSPLDLTESLLASSAFPGVFRPRWSPELFPYTHRDHQFIDGGVMDNLPIDAVVQLLLDASDNDPDKGLIVRRPTNKTPHLAFAASLEPEVGKITTKSQLLALQTYWPALRQRVKQLHYNRKLDNYGEAASEISQLYAYFKEVYHIKAAHTPLELEIAALKPKWLCGTFAFHPMLGYRRQRQVQSIAHGCAMTLLKFKQYGEKTDWLEGWGIGGVKLPESSDISVCHERWRQRKAQGKIEPGKCWLREDVDCPFSKEALNKLNKETDSCSKHLSSYTISQLSKIYACCSDLHTHEAH
jgi:predicted acylesterase/phospholipase RssA